MSGTSVRHREGIINALARANIALEDEASPGQRRTAVRSIHRALRKVAEDDILWADLVRRSDEPRDDRSGPDTELLEAIADLLTEEQARLLVMSGYRTPPPPPASNLIEATQRAVLAARTHMVLADLEHVRGALTTFLEELIKHLPRAEDRLLRRKLISGRKVLITAGLLSTVLNVEVTTGDNFDINPGISTQDGAKIEMTIPKPWGTDESQALLIDAAAVGLADQLTDSAKGMKDDNDDFGANHS